MKAAILLLLLPLFVMAEELLAYYSPSCECCTSYFSKLEKEGFKVKRVEVNPDKLMEVKSQLGIPPQLRSCHTMLYKNKFIEGHVPPEGIRRLSKDKSLLGVASPHGIKSARGGYEKSFFLVYKDKVKEVRP